MQVLVGILTISDSRSLSNDLSGDALEHVIRERQKDWQVARRECIPDNKQQIQLMLIHWSDDLGLQLILTTGGTGFSPTDCTPEATAGVLDRLAPGLVQAMIHESLKITPMGMLSRATAGIRNRSLIINLPGSKKGATECLSCVLPALPHAMDLLADHSINISATHQSMSGDDVVLGSHHCHRSQHGRHHGEMAKSVVDSSNIASRPRQSLLPMISVEEAQKRVLAQCAVMDVQSVDFSRAFGLVLAQDVFSKDPLPPFPASIKDGYAVLSSDGAGTRPVMGNSNAGNRPDADQPLNPGQCIRINTGAPVPKGADAVIQVEDTRLLKSSADGKEEVEIEILTAPVAGQDIRPIGSDIPANSKIVAKGTKIGAAEIGLMAAVGVASVQVHRRPKVALLSTGDELHDPTSGGEVPPGKIRDSNRFTLKALLEDENRFEVVDFGIAKDNPQDLLSKLRAALDAADLVVTTGGVSMGDRDFLREVLLQDLKAELHFGRVNMKPGKPTTFATVLWGGQEAQKTRKLIFGLPGNPVSATVTAHLYVLPACRFMSGSARPFAAQVRAALPCSWLLDPRPEYVRCVTSWQPGQAVAHINLTGVQISSRLASLSEANGLAVLPQRTDSLKQLAAGEQVDVLLIGALSQSL